MPECGNCGRHVSKEFVRVLADDDGIVHGCPICRAPPIAGSA